MCSKANKDHEALAKLRCLIPKAIKHVPTDWVPLSVLQARLRVHLKTNDETARYLVFALHVDGRLNERVNGDVREVCLKNI